MVDKLSHKDLAAYKKVFDEYKGKNGNVEYRHLQTMLNKLKINPSEQEMESIYDHLDIYANGSVCFAHFLSLMANKFSKEEMAVKARLKKEEEDDLQHEMREAFKVFDGDGNGFISQAELKHTLTNMGMPLSEEEIEEMMQEADTDGDGQVSFPEFCRLMTIQEKQDNPKARLTELSDVHE